MDTVDVILTRRSIRHFTRQPVSEADLEILLRAAMQAPTAGNTQPWHFLIMTDRDLLEKVTEFHPAAECLHEAPMAILVCGDTKLQKRPERWVLDCAAATQNILLAAHARGLGAVWIGIHPDPIRIEGICKLLELPEPIKPLSLVAVGYPFGPLPPVADRYNPKRIHRNTW